MDLFGGGSGWWEKNGRKMGGVAEIISKKG